MVGCASYAFRVVTLAHQYVCKPVYGYLLCGYLVYDCMDVRVALWFADCGCMYGMHTWCIKRNNCIAGMTGVRLYSAIYVLPYG